MITILLTAPPANFALSPHEASGWNVFSQSQLKSSGRAMLVENGGGMRKVNLIGEDHFIHNRHKMRCVGAAQSFHHLVLELSLLLRDPMCTWKAIK